MPSIPENILHYQKSIEKSDNDRPRLLHCIAKLYKLPITVQHLQETGIGRTVNALRKDEGEVGVAAKALVAKWKAMVAAEESSDEEADENRHDEDHISPSSNNQDVANKSSSIPNIQTEQKVHSKSSSNKSHKNDNEHHRHTEKSGKVSSSHNHRSSSDRRSSHSSKNESDSKKSSADHHNSKLKNDNIVENLPNHLENLNGNDTDDDDDDSDETGGGNDSDNNYVDDSKNRLDTDVIKDNRKNDSYRDEKRLKTDVNGCDSMKTGTKSDSSSSSNNSSNNNKLKRKHSPDKYEKDKSVESSHHNHHHSSNSKVKHESLSHNISSSTSSSNNGSSSNKNNKDSHKHHKSSKDKQKSNDDSRNEHKSSHHRHEHKSHHKSSSSSDRNDRKKDSKNESKHHSKSHKSDSGTESITSSSTNKRKSEVIDEKSSSSSKHKSSSSSSTKKPKSEKNETIIDCIDSSMGTSFADALGMIMPSSSSKSSSKTPKSTPAKQSPPTSTTTSKKPIEKPRKLSNETPILLSPSINLQPLEPELVMDLPVATISNNYKPLPLNPIVRDCVFNQNSQAPKRYMTDEEALGASFASKNLRTKVYSGVKSGAVQQIQTLHELCTRVLQKNIDALEYTGGVPYDILKPILERATPQQLFNFEHHNPYLLDDSDKLWEHHCKRNFRSQKQQDFETWREMYLRCTEEQAQRLSSLTSNIKHSQNIAVPLKQTKLAYVDSCVKPPRNVIKKQNQFGTERKLVATPAARVESLKTSCPNIAQGGDVRLKVLAGIRDTAQIGRSAAIAPKKAPLMAKTLQLMKGRFKR